MTIYLVAFLAVLLLAGLIYSARWLLHQRPTEQIPTIREPTEFRRVTGTHYRMKLPDQLRLRIRR